jgi:two-component system sensor histidine kinase AdeS
MKFLINSLRWRLAIAVAVTALGNFVVVILGMTAFFLSYDLYFTSSMPEDVQRHLDAWNQFEVLHPDQLAALKAWFATDPVTPRVELGALFIFSLIGVAIGASAGLLLGSRIARPVLGVVAAAKRIHAGDTAARADSRDASGEIALLISTFNALADGLQRAEHELDASASAIAHELRTPVAILKARLGAIRDGVFQMSEQEIAGLVAQVDTLTTIVGDLDTLSWRGSSGVAQVPESIDLAAEVALALEPLRTRLSDANIAPTLELAPTPAFADPARVRQVVNALVDNVIRHAAAGGTILIRTEAGHRAARLVVLDRGPGLPGGETQRVFDRFWRGDGSRSRETGGTGLGLSVVKAIAVSHGGSARAFPNEGGGAGFEVTFPAPG